MQQSRTVRIAGPSGTSLGAAGTASGLGAATGGIATGGVSGVRTAQQSFGAPTVSASTIGSGYASAAPTTASRGVTVAGASGYAQQPSQSFATVQPQTQSFATAQSANLSASLQRPQQLGGASVSSVGATPTIARASGSAPGVTYTGAPTATVVQGGTTVGGIGASNARPVTVSSGMGPTVVSGGGPTVVGGGIGGLSTVGGGVPATVMGAGVGGQPVVLGGELGSLLGGLAGSGVEVVCEVVPMGMGMVGPGGEMLMLGGPGDLGPGGGQLMRAQQPRAISMDDLPFSSIGHKAMWQGIFDMVQREVDAFLENHAKMPGNRFKTPRIPMPNIPDQQIAMIFDSYDMTRTGVMDNEQLKALMRDMQCVTCLAMSQHKGEALQEARQELTALMGPQLAHMMSGQMSQAMDFELMMVKELSKQPIPDMAVKELIQDLDADRDGRVSRNDFLRNAKKALFDPNPPEEIMQAIEAVEAMMSGAMPVGMMAIGDGGLMIMEAVPVGGAGLPMLMGPELGGIPTATMVGGGPTIVGGGPTIIGGGATVVGGGPVVLGGAPATATATPIVRQAGVAAQAAPGVRVAQAAPLNPSSVSYASAQPVQATSAYAQPTQTGVRQGVATASAAPATSYARVIG